MIDNFKLQIPPEAVQPNNLWWRVFKTGKHTASNGTTKTFSVNELETIVNNTKQYITDNNYPVINIDHIKAGEALGQLEDIRLRDDFLEVKVGYLTPEASNKIKAGKYPNRSVEIKNNKITGLALLGSANPALKGLGNTDFNFSRNTSENENKIYFYSSEEIIMEKDIKKTEVIEPVNFKDTDEYKSMNSEIEKAKKLVADKEKELAAYKQQSNSEITAIKTEFNDFNKKFEQTQAELEKNKLLSFAEKVKIPSISPEKIATMLYSIQANKSNDFLEFKDIASDTISKTTAVEMVKDILTKYSSIFNSMEHDIINNDFVNNIDTQTVKYKSFVKGNTVSDNQYDVDIFVKKYASDNKLSYNEALDTCISKDLI